MAKKLFQPGQSGNPSGRPKDTLGPLVRKETNDGKELVDRALRIMRKSRSEKNVLAAISWLSDRGWGRPIQAIGFGDDVDQTLTVKIVKQGSGDKWVK